MSRSVPLPRGPVLDWSSVTGPRAAGLPSVDDLPYQLPTTSGRAALFQAMRALQLAPGSAVLVPSYHCPTMVAPVVHAGLSPVFYALDERAAPQLSALDDRDLTGVRAIIVAHYFGQARSLAAERRWCDARGIALIEDCAHCLFGQAGERQVGAWGDFAIASLTKFLPVPEAGLLASAHRPIVLHPLPGQGLKAQAKGIVDAFERAHQHGRLRGLGTTLGLLLSLKNHRPEMSVPTQLASVAPPVDDPLQGCDLTRAGLAPVWAAECMHRRLPRDRVVRNRQRHHARLRQGLSGLKGARPAFVGSDEAGRAPYVLPLWVDDADRVYHGLRNAGWPVFRWDRRWPGQPALPGDLGDVMGRHVLQLPCHQDFREHELDGMITAVQTCLRGIP